MNYSVFLKGESYIDELGKGKDIVIKTETFIPWESEEVTDECSEVVSEKNGWEIIVHKQQIRKLHTISGNVFYYKSAENTENKAFVRITLLTGEKIDVNVNWIDYDLETKLVTISKDGKTYCLFISPTDNIVNDCGDGERINKAEVRYAGEYCYGERICY